jgi:osmotically-inducible protein OsmY
MSYFFRKLIGWGLLAAALQGCAAGMILGTAAVAGGAATVVINDRRSMEVQAQDDAINNRIRELFFQDGELTRSGQFYVDTYNRIALLTGETSDPAAHARAEQMARSVPEVRQVYNQLRLIPQGSDSAWIRQNDFFTTAKIKATLMKETGMGAVHTQVTTDYGIVYLMGLLTREEAEAVIEVVRRVEGVERVVPLFEYVRLVPTS